MLGETGLVSVNLIKSGPPFCTLHIVHCSLISFRQGRVAKRNGGGVYDFLIIRQGVFVKKKYFCRIKVKK